MLVHEIALLPLFQHRQYQYRYNMIYRYIVILSRFFTVSTLITMAFSLSTYCEQILLFYTLIIWLKRAPERGWTKKIVKKYVWYIFVQIECKIKHTMMSIHFFVLISVSRRSLPHPPSILSIGPLG